MNLHFRRGMPEDGKQLLSLHTRAIMQLGKGFYTAKELTSWAHGLTAEGYGLRMTREYYDIAHLPEGTIVGFCATQDNSVTGLFTDPDYARRGIASQLLTRAVERQRAQHSGPLQLTASLPALDFYLRHGWKETRRWMEISRGGLSMAAVDMELP